MEDENKEVRKKPGVKKVKPLKDFVILQNEVRIELTKGEELEVPVKFLANLKTEKVIK